MFGTRRLRYREQQQNGRTHFHEEPCDYPDCAYCPEGRFPLSKARSDQCVRLVCIEGGRAMRRRLAELGLNPGSEIRVVQTHGGGPMILAVKEDARMAIGRGMARHILVEPAGKNRAG